MPWPGKFKIRRKKDGRLGEAEITLFNLQGDHFAMVRWEGGRTERNIHLSQLQKEAQICEPALSSSRELLDQVDALLEANKLYQACPGRAAVAGARRRQQKQQQQQQQYQGKLLQQSKLQDERDE
ncbi:hypothetical protein VaNZ11_006451, partial [Volvox africanus]